MVSRNAVLCILVLVAAAGFYAIKTSTHIDLSHSTTSNTAALPDDVRHEIQIDIELASELGSEEDVKRRYHLEDELAGELGDHGVVDGGDIGDGVMGIFVVDIADLNLAIERVKVVLARHDLLATATILHWEVTLDGDELSDASMVWPPTYEGVFARWFWPEATNCEAMPTATP